MALHRRRRAETGGPAVPRGPSGDAFGELFPAIWEFLTLTVWPDDGKERETGSLLVFGQDGLMKARLVDPNTDEVAFWAADGVEELLLRVEEDLVAGRGDWRKQRPYNPPSGRRR
jgi:hypothetical protein